MRQAETATLHARILRQAMTPAETALWQALRDRRLLGLKFRRQVPLGPRIVGFYCVEQRLAVEVDGPAPDPVFERWLEDRSIRILRFTPAELQAGLSGCLRRIARETAP